MKQLTQDELLDCIEADKYRESREAYCTRMVNEGFQIYKPEPNEVLLDIDSEDAYTTFRERFERISEELIEGQGCIQVPTFKVFPSRSGGAHCHIIVTLPVEVEMRERLLLQVLLGSDPIRELLSLFRIWNGAPQPTLLAMKGAQND